ncbi:MAG TPA: PadR family transcriptional regulator [Pseudolysinimonas sp.]|jgi:DNA-binding PadR family transcriptional regulator
MRTSSTTGFDLRGAVDGLRETFGPRVAAFTGSRDIRAAILTELATEPMHGYQLIQAIQGRSQGAWTPTPGSVYPTLQLLADEGLATAKQDGERKVYTLTDAGTTAAAAVAGPDESKSESRRPWDSERAVLPKAGAKLGQAVGQVAMNGSAEQQERAVAIIDEARKKLYAILAED